MMPSFTRRVALATLLALVTVCGARALRAQVMAGDTVRITSVTFEYVGTLLGVDSSGVKLRSAGTFDTLTIPLAGVERSERLIGQHRGGESRFAAGMMIGIVGGVVVAAAKRHGEFVELERAAIRLLGVIVGVVGGAIASQTTVDEWMEFDPRQLAAISAPS